MSRKKARIAVGSRERANLKKWDKDDKCVASDALAQPISRRLDQGKILETKGFRDFFFKNAKKMRLTTI